MILLTGFGPFGTVTDNPSARLVRALDAQQIAGHRVLSLVLPVAWDEGPRMAVEAIRAHHPVLALGFGVAMERREVEVETTAVGIRLGDDVDARHEDRCVDGPPTLRARLDTDLLAASLGAGLSDDAGRYLCNAWLYEVLRHTTVPATFVHIPPQGCDPQQVALGLERFLTRPRVSA